MDQFFAVTAPGLETITAQELHVLFDSPDPGGSSPQILPAVPGGVPFKSDLAGLYRANLHLRTASRILARLGNFFRAITFSELQARAARLPWERFLSPGQPVALRVTCHHSKLYHSDAVLRSVAAGLADRLGKPSPILKVDEDPAQPPQLVVVRIANDICTISLDSSGELLHRRGYRLAVARAPLRETLAAAVLLASGWDCHSPLLDPFCGSGTLPIEAALLALGIPPGINRRFAFMDWPGYEYGEFKRLLPVLSGSAQVPILLASDRDAGAVRMAMENAARAGVGEWIDFKCQAISSITPPTCPGWVVTNPPYGLRVSAGKDLRDLYARFGDVLREKCPRWDVSVLCSDPVLLGQLHLHLDSSLSFTNGGLRVRLARGKVEDPPSPEA